MRPLRYLFGFAMIVGMTATAQAQQWQKIAPIPIARRNAGYAMLPDGRILVAGGSDFNQVFSDCEIYDPLTDTWTKTGSLNQARWGHLMMSLPNGKVLAVGGLIDVNVGATNTCEIYEPSSGTWRPTTSFPERSEGPTGLILPDGSVILFGTLDFTSFTYDPSVYQFDWQTESIQKISSRPIGSWATQCVYSSQMNGMLMTSGEIGGANGDYLRSTQFYSFASKSWSLLDSLVETVAGSKQLIATDSGIYFVSGRINGTVASNNVERFNVHTQRWEIAGTVPVTTDWGHSFQINSDTILTVGGLGSTLNFSTPVSTSVLSISKGVGTAGPVMITPRTSQCTIMAEEPDPQNPCVMQKVIFAFAGQDSTSNMISSCEKLVVGTLDRSSYPVTAVAGKITHGTINQTVPYSLPILLPPTSTMDSLLNTASSFDFRLTFDTSALQVATILPPNGWRLLSESILGNAISASFTKLNASTHTLDTLGSIFFTIVDVTHKHAALSLTSFDLKDSGITIPFCVTIPEGVEWDILLDSASASVSLEQDHFQVSEIYPDPGLEIAHLNIRSERQAHLVVQVFDALGREIKDLEQRSLAHVGNNPLQFDASELENGSYFFRIASDGDVITKEWRLMR